MQYDQKDQGLQDQARINLNKDLEVQLWTRKLHVDERTLKEAVRQVGPSESSIRRFLSGS